MSAIGIKLRRLARHNSLLGIMRAYAYAGLVGAGPWIWSIVGILLVGLLGASPLLPNAIVSDFQVSATYLIAASLIITGPMQLALTRFTSDRLFDKQLDAIVPNFTGALLTVTAGATVLGLLAAGFVFDAQGELYRALMVTGFVLLCDIWIASVFLAGLKQYSGILRAFFAGYAVTTVAAVALKHFGLEGLLYGFVLGQTLLLLLLLTRVYGGFPATRVISFDLFRRVNRYPTLMLIGLLYNVGIWIDKIMFWYAPGSGQAVVGPLHASVIYDIPIFLAYLAITPGMAVFLLRVETEFARHYGAFNTAIREGGSLQQIEYAHDAMAQSLRSALFDIVKVQTLTVLVVLATGPLLLDAMGISRLYMPLLSVQVIATSLQMVFLAIMNSFIYLDRRRPALVLIAAFCALNGCLTAATLAAGPVFYGYGFAISLLVVVLVGLGWLDRKLDTLEYEIFMLQ
ncbi:exopolysaccharide Pel transporter PelG [Burkholderia stagnalis]|uniref:exopolysaccharide Pel transporter PelG n=1 Tax=Burkholderia stagnalis TaxID=1503054 RepID=UPI000F7FD5C8|nr:exopolysaccharide Pel transporter PelG [Burkholderia stagnalis]